MSGFQVERNTIRQYEERLIPSDIEDLKFGIEIVCKLYLKTTQNTSVSANDFARQGNLIALVVHGRNNLQMPHGRSIMTIARHGT
jgi:hypothetical protein